jgi:hypothetical protein
MKYAKKLLTLGLGALGLVSCSTPKPECTVAATTTIPVGLSGVMAFAVRYVPDGGASCPEMLMGDVVGMQAYHPASAEDPQLRDFGKTSVAIRTQSHGELTWMNEDFGFPTDQDQPNAIGDFTAVEPDANDICQVPTVSEARVVFPGAEIPIDTEIPCMTDQDCTDGGADGATCTPLDPMDPMAGNTCIVLDIYAPTDLAYRWSNVQVYVTAAALGTQFTADVEVTLNGCTAKYKAVGMWPAVDCTGITEFDADGNPTATGPLDEYCHPQADPTNPRNPRPYGSGISPDFGPVVCDANFAPISVVNQYYGGTIAHPRCTLGVDTIPSLEGFPELSTAPAE